MFPLGKKWTKRKRIAVLAASLFCSFASSVTIQWFASSTHTGMADGCSQVVLAHAKKTDDGSILFHAQLDELDTKVIKEFQNFYFDTVRQSDVYSFQYPNRIVLNASYSGRSGQLLGLDDYSIAATGVGIRASSTLEEKGGMYPLEDIQLDAYFSYQSVLQIVKTASGESLMVSDNYADRILASSGYASYLSATQQAPTDGTYWSLIGKTIPFAYYDHGELVHKHFRIFNVFSLASKQGPRMKSLYGDGVVLSYMLGTDAALSFKGIDIDIGKSNFFNNRFMSNIRAGLEGMDCSFSFASLQNGAVVEEPDLLGLFTRAYCQGASPVLIGLSATLMLLLLAASAFGSWLCFYAVNPDGQRPYWYMGGLLVSILLAEGMWLGISFLAPAHAFVTTLGGGISVVATAILAVCAFEFGKRREGK